jgi:outer membrane immunogenic protein
MPSAIAIAWMTMTPAFAADMSALPWLPPSADSEASAGSFADPFAPLAMHSGWSGFYLGGELSYSDISGDFSAATQQPIAYSLRETALEAEFAPSQWQVLGKATTGAAGFGGFIGYNTELLSQNAKVILGVEANYQQASLSVVAPNSPISRVTPAESGVDSYLVNITGSGAVSDLNFGTLRGRAGLDLGNFLPYMFAGFALGRANVNIAETISGEQNPPAAGPCSGASSPPCTPFSFSGTAGMNGAWLYGVSLGAGLDIALTPHIFLRGEYEYDQFAEVAGTIIELNTARVGAGIKF